MKELLPVFSTVEKLRWGQEEIIGFGNKEISVSEEWSEEGDMVTVHNFQDVSVNGREIEKLSSSGG